MSGPDRSDINEPLKARVDFRKSIHETLDMRRWTSLQLFANLHKNTKSRSPPEGEAIGGNAACNLRNRRPVKGRKDSADGLKISFGANNGETPQEEDNMRKWTKLAAASLVTLFGTLPAMAGEITVYTAYEEDEIAAYVAAAEKALPDIKINILRLSTGTLAARLIAEAANPQADMIWGQAITATMDPQIIDQLEPYKAKGTEALDAKYRDADNRWFAPTGYMGTFCVNTERLAQKGLPMPKSWADLENPAFKDEVIMPDPTSSGTGYLHVISLLQGLGEEKGWALLSGVDKNIAQYTSSGSKPCKSARTGEYTVGISLAITGVQSVEQGYPIALTFPTEGTGYELEAAGLMKASKNKKDVKRFMDWLLSPEAVSLYSQYKILITAPGAKPSEAAAKAGVPENVHSILANIDFAKSAKDQNAIKSTWTEKFGR